MPRVAILGGGLAGLAAAAALGSTGAFEVDLYEARPFLGGRATSWPAPSGDADDEEGEMIDNCQHVLLRCCVNLLDLYQRLGYEKDAIRLGFIHYNTDEEVDRLVAALEGCARSA